MWHDRSMPKHGRQTFNHAHLPPTCRIEPTLLLRIVRPWAYISLDFYYLWTPTLSLNTVSIRWCPPPSITWSISILPMLFSQQQRGQRSSQGQRHGIFNNKPGSPNGLYSCGKLSHEVRLEVRWRFCEESGRRKSIRQCSMGKTEAVRALSVVIGLRD
jgi:hypothetical protein